MSIHTAPRALLDELDAASIPYEVIPHRHTDTALEEAEAVHVDAFRVAKTIILTTPNGFVRAVVPACERLDMHKVRELLGTNHVELASEDVLPGLYPEYEPGAVPPFPGTSGDIVIVDGRLDKSPYVVLAAGTHEESVRMRTSDFVAITDAQLCDLCEDRTDNH
jgi:Ala-tRNA(Pro) deacylase